MPGVSKPIDTIYREPTFRKWLLDITDAEADPIDSDSDSDYDDVDDREQLLPNEKSSLVNQTPAVVCGTVVDVGSNVVLTLEKSRKFFEPTPKNVADVGKVFGRVRAVELSEVSTNFDISSDSSSFTWEDEDSSCIARCRCPNSGDSDRILDVEQPSARAVLP